MDKAQVLVVEDEGLVALSLQKKLQNLGYLVPSVAGSAEEAVRQAVDMHPDLILMDIMLEGGMDGIDAATLIRERMDVPVVYLTAYSDEATIERAKETGPFGYLVKPFEERELRTTIEMALYKHRAEKRLREREEWLATTLRSIGDAVIATDEETRVRLINPVAEGLTGWREKEALSSPVENVFTIVNEETGGPAENPVVRCLQEGSVVGLADHTLLIARDGTGKPIDDCAAPIKDERGRSLGAVLVFRDITEQKRMRDELRRHRDHLQDLVEERTAELRTAKEAAEAANRAKSAFLTNMSHEIRTPLTGVLGMAEMLRATPLNEKQARYVDIIETSGKNLLSLINDILDLARVETGRIEFNPVTLPLRDLLDDVKKFLLPQAEAKGLLLRTRISPEADAHVHCDMARLRQVLANLAGNAIKFTDNGVVSVDISAVDRGDESLLVRFDVADTGIGIPAELQEKIFEPFEQLDNSLTRRHSGTGIGLSISRRIVELMGGEIGVESEPGKGSQFWFILRLPLLKKKP